MDQTNSRTKNTVRNSGIGLSLHLLGVIFAFINRTIFIKVLGVEYLGINGLFANILTMLSISDLGLYTVMTYSLYKPLAENDKPKVAALVHYFQKLYNWIALGVLGTGLLLIPLLPKLVHGVSFNSGTLTKYYLILLLNSVLSYFAISRPTLFRADQKVYIIQIINTACTLLMYITQIISLCVWRNFTIYLICQVSYTFCGNVLLFFYAGVKYPYVRMQGTARSAIVKNKEIWNNIKSSFLYRFGAYVLNSTDNILISILISTATVGYFSNYVTIYTFANTLVMILIGSVLGSIGNFMALESESNKYQLFKMLMLVMYALAALASSCYLAGMNDFIRIWIGPNFIIGGSFIYVLVFNRFLFCSIHPLWMIRESAGVFASIRYVMLVAAILNIIFSVVLAKLIGISGIILATSVSYLLTVYWYEPLQLSKAIFHNSIIEYWKYVIKLLTACILPLLMGICLMHIETINIFILLLKFLGCGLVTFISFSSFFEHTKEYVILMEKVKKIWVKLITRKQKTQYTNG